MTERHMAETARAATQVLEAAREAGLPARYVTLESDGSVSIQVSHLAEVENWAAWLDASVVSRHSVHRVTADLWDQPVMVYAVDAKQSGRAA